MGYPEPCPEGMASPKGCIFDSVFPQECTILILKGTLLMMLFLGRNIPSHALYLRLAHRKRPVPVLPGKLGQHPPLRLDPLGRSSFDFAYYLCDRELT